MPENVGADSFRTDDADTSVAITPCTSGQSSNTFACGMNATACTSSNTFALSTDTSLVLRPAQIAALLNKSLPSNSVTTSTVTAVPSGYYTGGAMAGLAIGIAIPLLVALGVLYMLLRRERNKFGHASTNKNLMYKLPDDLTEDLSKPPPPPPAITTSHVSSHGNSFASNRSSHASAANSVAGSAAASSMSPSRRASKWTIQTASSRPVLSRDFPPNQSQTFLERYEVMKARAAHSQEVTISIASVPGTPALGTPALSGPGTPGLSGPGTPVAGTPQPQELDSTPTAEGPRYELSDTRMST